MFNTLISIKTNEHMTSEVKPYLWVYWEIKAGHKGIHPFINLCLKIIKQKCSQTYNVVMLNEKNVYDYLPDHRDLSHLTIALKSDYIRAALLQKYGGVWVDADTIVLTDLHEIIDKLNEGHDYVGFGSTAAICTDNGYPRPSTWVMASQKEGKLMTELKNELDKMLDVPKDKQNFEYFDLSKLVLWKKIEKLQKEQNYKYYHFSVHVDGTRDENGVWVSPNLIFKDKIKYAHPDKLMLIMLACSSIYCGKDPKYNWFCKLSEDEIINGDMFISSLFRKALGMS